jgi:hypothetical protein
MKNKHPHNAPSHTHPDNEGEPHHGAISTEPYGQRYPKGASSIEADLDRGIQTEIETHRRYLKHQQEVWGDVVPSVHDEHFMRLALTELLWCQKRQLKIMQREIPVGKTYMYAFKQGANVRTTHINFADSSAQNVQLPSGVNMFVPERPLFSVHVFNDGPGTLAAQINGEINEFESTETLKPGEDLEFTYKWPIIRTLNLVAVGATDVNLRVITMY